MPNLVPYQPGTPEGKTYGNRVLVLATGQSSVVDARGMTALSIIPEALSGAVVSRVCSDTASTDSATTCIGTSAKLTVPVDFPFHRITAGGTGNISVACA